MTTTAPIEEIAWAAGFVDGEGHFGYRRRSGERGTPVFCVSQVRPEPLERLARVLGLGRVLGPYLNNSPNSQPYYRIEIQGFRVTQQVIAILWNYLSFPKQEQAVKVLLEARRIHTLPTRRGKRDTVYELIKVGTLPEKEN